MTPSVAATSLGWMFEYMTGIFRSSYLPAAMSLSVPVGSVSALSQKASHSDTACAFFARIM